MKKIYFTGYYEVEDCDFPDDLGTAQLWAVQAIKNAVYKDEDMTDQEASQYDYGSKLFELLNLELKHDLS